METLRLYRGIVFFGVLLSCALLERVFPLRPRRDSTPRRWLVNLSMLALVAATVHLLTMPIVLQTLSFGERRGLGLLRVFEAPPWARLLLGIVALDYTLYVWHWLNHRVPFLWRFHSVHHADRDMDVTTGTRFHLGELVLSGAYRAAQVSIIGADVATLIVFEALMNASAQFHHANVRLPLGLERALNLVAVTPRMHELHHSTTARETHSNFSTIFSVWDRLHGTMTRRKLTPATAATDTVIGLPGAAYERPLGLLATLLLPLKRAQ
jgi:sterol desaturase/sphingolipid hydroxylase (fatty acid hydroxylase superfamily)